MNINNNNNNNITAIVKTFKFLGRAVNKCFHVICQLELVHIQYDWSIQAQEVMKFFK